MSRFNTKVGAGVLVGVGLVYMIVSLATGRGARAELPVALEPDPAELGLDVWQLADLRLREGEGVAVVDLRSAGDHARYAVPGSVSEAGAGARRLAELAAKRKVIVVHATDDAAGKLVAEARRASGSEDVYYLKGGARSWYLALELPVPLFSDKPVPHGYEEALAVVREHFSRGGGDAARVKQALDTLVRLEYGPTLLGKAKKKKTAGKRKKIAGGCG